MPAIANTANRKKVADKPTLSNRIGKNKPTRKLKSQRNKTAIPIPIPLILAGKISDNVSHVIGPTAPWKKAK